MSPPRGDGVCHAGRAGCIPLQARSCSAVFYHWPQNYDAPVDRLRQSRFPWMAQLRTPLVRNAFTVGLGMKLDRLGDGASGLGMAVGVFCHFDRTRCRCYTVCGTAARISQTCMLTSLQLPDSASPTPASMASELQSSHVLPSPCAASRWRAPLAAVVPVRFEGFTRRRIVWITKCLHLRESSLLC